MSAVVHWVTWTHDASLPLTTLAEAPHVEMEARVSWPVSTHSSANVLQAGLVRVCYFLNDTFFHSKSPICLSAKRQSMTDYWLHIIPFLKVKTASRLTLVPQTLVPTKASAGHLILITSANAQPSSQVRLANKMLMSVLRSHLHARTVVCAWTKWAPIAATALPNTQGNTARLCTSPATHHHAIMAGPASKSETQTINVPVCQVGKHDRIQVLVFSLLTYQTS